MRDSARAIEVHNRKQQAYFEGTWKQTMVPRASCYLSRHVDSVIEDSGLRSGQRVLDVGCGMGRYTLLLAERGFAVEGIELTAGLLDKLRAFNNGRYHIPLHVGDVVDYARALENRFDAVVGFFTLHHVHDLRACYAAMSCIVRPGGWIVFLEPNPFNLSYYIQMMVTPGMTWAGERGMLRMRRAPVFEAMRRAGLVDTRLQRFGLFPPALADRSWAPVVERRAENLLRWTGSLAFQVFAARRPLST